jgi:hypothetical protein
MGITDVARFNAATAPPAVTMKIDSCQIAARPG